MTLKFRLVGFDQNSDTLVVEHGIPTHLTQKTLRIANPNERPVECLGDVLLSEEQAARLAALLGKSVDLQGREFFLEP